jgi:hypothetical protein
MILTKQTDIMPPNELIMAIIPSNEIPNETKCDRPFAASAVKLDREEMARQEAGTLSKQLLVYVLYNHPFDTPLNSRSSPPDPIAWLGQGHLNATVCEGSNSIRAAHEMKRQRWIRVALFHAPLGTMASRESLLITAQLHC